MSLRMRLILLSGLSLLTILITCLIGLNGIANANQTINDIYQDRVVPLRNLKIVADFYAVNIVDSSHKVKNGSLSHEQGISQITAAQAGISRAWGEYMASKMEGQESQIAQENQRLMQEANAVSQELKQAMQNQDTAALEQIVTQKMYSTIEPVSDKISELITLQLDVAKKEHAAAVEAYKATRLKNIALLLLFGLGLAAGSYWLISDINRAVRSANQFASDIAAGNLSQTPPAAGQDELGSLLTRLGQMQGGLRSTVQAISSSSTAVGSASGELSRGSMQISAAIDLQNQASASLAASVEEMTVSVAHITDNSKAVSHATDHALQASQTSSQIIHATQSALKQMSGTIEAATQQILQLQDQSNAIGQISKVIRDIADQTNLLALNAAIEAARAGDTGRGFAVVADEVRKLAERTTQSTVEINHTINAIQSGTTDAASIMNQALNEVQQGVHHAGAAAESVQNSHSAARSVHTAIHEIVNSLREQRQVCQLISQNIERIAQASEENSQAVQANASTAQQLDKQAQALSIVVATFTL